MKSILKIGEMRRFMPGLALIIIGAIVYLPFINHFGYYNDDWYLMYAARAKGPNVFLDIYGVDRPLRALVMMPAYIFFGPNPIYYDLSAIFFRILAAFGFYGSVHQLWPGKKTMIWIMSLLFLIFPGFLSLFNGIDYQSQMVSLACAMFSMAFSIKAFFETRLVNKIFLYLLASGLTWVYLGLVEYFVGIEAIKLLIYAILVIRESNKWPSVLKHTFLKSLPLAAGGVPFLIWRLFIFESARGATDVDLQFDFAKVISSPVSYIAIWSRTVLNDAFDTFIRAWFTPMIRLGSGINFQLLIPGISLSVVVLIVLLSVLRVINKADDDSTGASSPFSKEATLIGVGSILLGLLPVILVGRTIDFRSYTRYSLIASSGVAILWPALLSFIDNRVARNMFVSVFVVAASITHYLNGVNYSNQTEAVNNFWWQVSWRIPQLDEGTTLIAHYFIVAEEDYFIWGPANMIYYPESMHPLYVQPGIYAALLNDVTVSKVLARSPQEFSNRRGIRTYPNYKNILVISRPSPGSCVQVIDGNQVELSTREDSRILPIAPFSEIEHIWLEDSFHEPPAIPFGDEPVHDWCYFFEKASYFRQVGDWEQVANLGDEALRTGYHATDMVEWLPFVEAYAQMAHVDGLKELAAIMRTYPIALSQACHLLNQLKTSLKIGELAEQLFCINS